MGNSNCLKKAFLNQGDQQSIRDAFNKFDIDGDGNINFDEFLNLAKILYKEFKKGISEKEMEELTYLICSTNNLHEQKKSGEISKKQCEKIIINSYAKELFGLYDSNNDKHISFAEFEDFVKEYSEKVRIMHSNENLSLMRRTLEDPTTQNIKLAFDHYDQSKDKQLSKREYYQLVLDIQKIKIEDKIHVEKKRGIYEVILMQKKNFF
eukprot:TRINITY_DN5620_c0_g1_i1.p1 TRINITY_DN5620_c0_g1~~TRINITY_DN5620_c0_g1_i1.p1  ORF type:complete len:208 (-),score=43.48 TRINITY_DN5620_c0_g1_i1:267-890(-)